MGTDSAGYCHFIEANGIDGLAFGIHAEIGISSVTEAYVFGFRDSEKGDVGVNFFESGDFETCWYYQGYTVTADVLTSTLFQNCVDGDSAFYGFDSRKFHGWYYNLLTADFSYQDAFRFIGASENDGARWAVGDTIDAFAVDWENDEYKDNPGFLLAGSTALAAGGVALLAAVMM